MASGEWDSERTPGRALTLFAMRYSPFPIRKRRAIIASMRNGLYSLHVRMVDQPGKGSGVFVLHDGQMLGGNGLVWLAGTYTFDARGRWKGELITVPYALIRTPGDVFENQTVSIGFSGTYTHDSAETFNTGFVGKRSIAFHTTMRFLAEA